MGTEQIRATTTGAQPATSEARALSSDGRCRRLINIDNGGTFTDICVVEGARVLRTKTVTTPYDLSECLFNGLRRVSAQLGHGENLERLLRGADLIRYSTTQGTNALVERKGQRLGLIVDNAAATDDLRGAIAASELFEVLVGRRVAILDANLDDDALDRALVAVVHQLTSDGANRIVVCFSGADYIEREKRIEHIMLKRFPTHLLGSVPLLFSHEITDDARSARRTWSALFNAFLHPAMEQFLYAAQRRMRSLKTAAPLLIFRNDGGSARIAKTIALKTFGSGPRGGMEGVKALARHYGFDELISVDVGGTTSDIGMVADGTIRSQRHGVIEGVEVSFPLADVVSVGVGGSSVIRSADGEIRVGPQSVGSMPGPACFGRGGREATITDAFLLAGVFDPKSFFGGGLRLEAEPGLKAVMDNIAKPLGLSLEDALVRMEEAWAGKIADGILAYSPVSARIVLTAFGGAGPMSICKVAEKIGVSKVIVPGQVAVFSAVGIGFSDLSQEYQLQVRDRSAAALEGYLRELEGRAARDMFAEKIRLADCTMTATVACTVNGIESVFPFVSGAELRAELAVCDEAVVQLRVVRPLERPPMVPVGGESFSPAVSDSTRRIYIDGRWEKVPVYEVDSQNVGASAEGPAIIEEQFFTGKIERGWRFAMSANRDLIVSKI